MVKSSGMVDVTLPQSLNNAMENPRHAHVWVIEDMSDTNGPPWLEVFTEASAAMVALTIRLKLTIVVVHETPMENLWTIADSKEVVGALYYRPVKHVQGIVQLDDKKVTRN